VLRRFPRVYIVSCAGKLVKDESLPIQVVLFSMVTRRYAKIN
jgi:hypothetical protein